MYQQRLTQLKTWMSENHCELAYLNEPTHISYFSGFLSEPHERVLALFVPIDSDPFLFTPSLEVEDAQNSPWSYDVVGYLDSENPWKIITNELNKRTTSIKNIAIEKDFLPVANYEQLKENLSNVTFHGNLTPFLQQMLLVKTEDEKNKLMDAGKWADLAFEIGFKAINNGVKEFELVAEIEYQLKLRGVSTMSFDTLVLAGTNAASPHGSPSENTIKPNELVLFDLGVVWNGYCSDATRTVAYKEPTDFQQKIYDIVLKANKEAMNAVKPGVKASELDKIARDIITDAGYGQYFNHRLGHGIGTSVHEFPSIVEGNDMIIQEGMCFSVEPGIYIPEKVGVRIEDCLYVTKDGHEAFTKTPKDLKIVQ